MIRYFIVMFSRIDGFLEQQQQSGNEFDSGYAALQLIETIPATRDAALEHIGKIFVNYASNYIRSGSTQNAANDEVLFECRNTMQTLVQRSSRSWLITIFKWCKDLLMSLIPLYRSNLGLSHASFTLSEHVTKWLQCPAANTLIDLLNTCLHIQEEDGGADELISQVISASAKSAPFSEWILLQIGLNFPQRVLKYVIENGIKTWNVDSGAVVDSPSDVMYMEVVSCMAVTHSAAVKSHLLQLFESSLQSSCSRPVMNILYILFAASKSSEIRNLVLEELLECISISFINDVASGIYYHYLMKSSEPAVNQQICTLLVDLLMKSGEKGLTILIFVVENTCSAATRRFSKESSAFLDLVLGELLYSLQRIVHSRHSTSAPPEEMSNSLIQAISKDYQWLCELFWSCDSARQEVVDKLLGFICIYYGESLASEVFLNLIFTASSPEKTPQILNLVKSIHIYSPYALESWVKNILNPATSQGREIHLLSSMLFLLQSQDRERIGQETQGLLRIGEVLKQNARLILHYVANPNKDVMKLALKLAERLSWSNSPDRPMNLELIMFACNQMNYAFINSLLLSEDSCDRLLVLEFCKQCVHNLCCNDLAQVILCHIVCDTLFSKHFMHLFGCERDRITTKSVQKTSLIKDVFIGSRVKFNSASKNFISPDGSLNQKPMMKFEQDISKERILSNQQNLMEFLVVCLSNSNGNGVLRESCVSILADFFVQYVCQEITYPGIIWPEPEIVKQTVERDLLILRRFQEYPLLWEVLDFVSQTRPQLSEYSVLAFSLMAALRLKWENAPLPKASMYPSLLEASSNLFRHLRQAQFLPPPLCYLDEVLDVLTPYEVHIIFHSCWKYIKEFPPAANSYKCLESGMVPSRVFPSAAALKPCIEPIHLIFQKNIASLGNVYRKFFLDLNTRNSVPK